MKTSRIQLPRTLARSVEAWFCAHARDLPWRVTPRDPYLSVVSEFMLQQTQVSRVIEHFAPFIARFSDFRALSGAPECDVLAMWSGLGYYRRAKNLHALAKAVVQNHRGALPTDAKQLLALPGIGRYTAGALASIVFGQREPLVDANVARVLLRVHGQGGALDQPDTARWLWDRAAGLVQASADPAALNEGLMELGATVCSLRQPECTACPLRASCTARSQGLTDQIPRPKRTPRRTLVHCCSVIVTDPRGRMLVEQRPDQGMWASMWQAPTLERQGRRPPTRGQVEEWANVGSLTLADLFTHQTSHREVRFAIWRATEPKAGKPGGRAWIWRNPAQIARLGLSTPQRRILLK